jgi:hypothetical protein
MMSGRIRALRDKVLILRMAPFRLGFEPISVLLLLLFGRNRFSVRHAGPFLRPLLYTHFRDRVVSPILAEGRI